ncbi:hypothetical protein cypCar_00000648 [Cyprinus carpio]|nr:hypothetical protein cypCar_00000648 [Cyprinus carpio]
MRSKVEAMCVELEEAKKKVAEFQKQCEEYLVVILQPKREADEQQKAVDAHSEKIEAEEIKCKAMAENAQRDLDEVLPALEEAMKPFVLEEASFIKQLVNFDKDNVSDCVLKTTGQYCMQPDFQPEIIGRVSLAAKSLCMWVRAMEVQQS